MMEKLIRSENFAAIEPAVGAIKARHHATRLFD
jgi:hypothetical protein